MSEFSDVHIRHELFFEFDPVVLSVYPRKSARMHEDHIRSLRELTALRVIYDCLESFACIARIYDNSLLTGKVVHSVTHFAYSVVVGSVDMCCLKVKIFRLQAPYILASGETVSDSAVIVPQSISEFCLISLIIGGILCVWQDVDAFELQP